MNPTPNPFLLEQARIAGLPDTLAVVPDDRYEFEAWRIRMRAYRELIRRECETNKRAQAAEMQLCQNDPAYWLVMYGVIFEPRFIDNQPPRWMPWIPYAFQVKVIRWIQHVMTQTRNGRGDGILEKSRDMGMSWLFCAYIAWSWLFEPVFVAGLVSRNSEAVDKTGSTDSLFFKVRAELGLESQIPAFLRMPEWMKPRGFNDDYVVSRSINHPHKTCIIMGETTTSLSGVGGRATLRLNDEAARFKDFDETWANQSGTTTHKFAISSADNRASGFRQLAMLGAAALRDEHIFAPSYMRLDWYVHPMHDQEWYINEKARFAHDPHYFAREYEISYAAGEGDAVYPRFANVELGTFPYDPALGTLYCSIDPGMSDPAAIVWIQEDPLSGTRYRVVNSFEGKGGEDAEFFASILTGVPISGPGGYDYGAYPGLYELMEWTASLNRRVVYYGDHFGNHRGADGRRTFYEALRETSADLTNRTNIINVVTTTADGARTFMKRKLAVSSLASRMDFNNNKGGSAVLTALKESRYPDSKTGSRVTEVLEPQHDRFSHMRTAVEYWAVNVTIQETVAQKGVALPIRQNMSGRRIR